MPVLFLTGLVVGVVATAMVIGLWIVWGLSLLEDFHE